MRKRKSFARSCGGTNSLGWLETPTKIDRIADLPAAFSWPLIVRAHGFPVLTNDWRILFSAVKYGTRVWLQPIAAAIFPNPPGLPVAGTVYVWCPRPRFARALPLLNLDDGNCGAIYYDVAHAYEGLR